MSSPEFKISGPCAEGASAMRGIYSSGRCQIASCRAMGLSRASGWAVRIAERASTGARVLNACRGVAATVRQGRTALALFGARIAREARRRRCSRRANARLRCSPSKANRAWRSRASSQSRTKRKRSISVPGFWSGEMTLMMALGYRRKRWLISTSSFRISRCPSSRCSMRVSIRPMRASSCSKRRSWPSSLASIPSSRASTPSKRRSMRRVNASVASRKERIAEKTSSIIATVGSRRFAAITWPPTHIVGLVCPFDQPKDRTRTLASGAYTRR